MKDMSCGNHDYFIVILRTLNTKRVMVLLLKLLKTSFKGFEILVCRPNIHGSAFYSRVCSTCMLHAREVTGSGAACRTSRRSLARIRSPRSAISYKVSTIGGRSNISAVKAPVGGSSKSVVLITTEFSVAIVSAYYLCLGRLFKLCTVLVVLLNTGRLVTGVSYLF